MNIGYDVDGTLTSRWFVNFDLEDLYKTDIGITRVRDTISSLLPTVIPVQDVIVLITSRPSFYRHTTKGWLLKYVKNINSCANISVYCPNSIIFGLEEMAAHKSSIINSLCLDEYYEDGVELRRMLKMVCPNTEILPPEEAIKRKRVITYIQGM